MFPLQPRSSTSAADGAPKIPVGLRRDAGGVASKGPEDPEGGGEEESSDGLGRTGHDDFLGFATEKEKGSEFSIFAEFDICC